MNEDDRTRQARLDRARAAQETETAGAEAGLDPRLLRPGNEGAEQERLHAWNEQQRRPEEHARAAPKAPKSGGHLRGGEPQKHARPPEETAPEPSAGRVAFDLDHPERSTRTAPPRTVKRGTHEPD